MKKRLSRINTSILSFVLAAAMVMGLSGMTALAAESNLDSTESETQTIIVKEWGDGNTPEGAVYPYHLCQVTKAFYPIDSMDDIVTYEPGAGLSYTIYDSYTDEEIGIGTTDEEGGFSLQVDQYAEFTVEADTTWYVNQDDPEDSPLLNVTADGRHATVVDEYNGVVQHTPDYDTSKLEKEYNNDLLLDETDYTEESWAPFAEALEKAKEVLDDESATQDEIDQALEDLENAREALKKAESESGQPDPTPSPDPDPDPDPEPEPTETVTISTGLNGNEKAYDGESVTLTAKVNDVPENAEVSYQWYKDGTEIEGAVESTYIVPGNVSDSGTYKCVVTVKDGTTETTAEAEVDLTITKAEQEISFETDSVEKLDYDEPFIHPLIETDVVGEITYTSSDESIATVDPSTGEVTIHGTGIAIITATAAGDDNHAEAHAFYTLLVNEDILQWEVKADRGEVTWDEEKGEFVDNLSYTGEPIELTLTLMLTDEEKEEIEAMSFQWYRFNPETQEFDAIEGATDTTYTLEGEDVNAGTYVYMCEVTANYRNGREHTVHSPIEINIAKLAQSISYGQTEIAKTTDDKPFTNDLTIETISPEDGAGITYVSSDTTVATVDENGLVTLLGAGTATITATAAETTNYAEASASYTLTVSEPASTPEQPEVRDVKVTSDLAGDEKTYDGEGVILTVKADVEPEDAEISYQWYKDDEPIDDAADAKLVLDGNVSDSGTYTCVVTAESDGLTASAEDTVTIMIEQAAQNISYEQAVVLKMDYDGSFINDLTETAVYGRITYSSSDQTVATVDSETGTVTIKGNGITTITATAAGSENYTEAEASYTLLVNTDEVAWEVDVNHDQLTWDEEKEEWVAELTYNGDSLELEMIISLSEAQQAEVGAITYQWYRFVPDTQEFEEIDGATEDTFTLEGEAVNAGDYRYMCMAVVTYNNGNAYTIYSPIEIVIEKALQEISYQETELNKTTNDKAFTNPLTETTVDMDGGADITYESSDETIATVDESGEVTILAAGDVTITATVSETANYEAATASYTLLIEEADEPWETVQYAVRLWGINRDVDEEGNVLGLTFGPATGASYIDDYEAHLTKEAYEADDEAYCIHWMTWDEIIAQSAMDPTVFSDCLENGCTKAVELTPNNTIFNSTAVDNALEQGYTGDGVGTLYYLLNGTGAYQSRYNCGANWNYTTKESSDAAYANVYSQSRIRVTLNGDKSDAWLPFASSDNGADLCDEYDCLLYCFPVELQTAIVPRETINAGQPTQGVAADDKTTYDKLWLLSMAEVGLSSISDDSGGTEYGITTSSDSRKAYEFSGKDAEEEHATTWWLRSRYSGYSGGNYVDAYFVATGGASGYGAASNTQGLSPCFCLAGPKEPTVEVMITATGDTDKTYDGNGISLTAHATVTPEETNVTCQWYKDDVPIEGANYSLYNVEGNVSDSGIYKCVVTATNNAGEATAEAEVAVEITKAAQEISYETKAVTKTIGDDAFTNPLKQTAVSKEEGAGITYASSKESIATVDEDGKVKIIAPGTATITATAASTANYAKATASYTLTIMEVETGGPTVRALTVTSNAEGNSKVYDGTGITLTAIAEYTPADAKVTYQWYKVVDDTDEIIEGATDSNYITGEEISDSGTYKCVVTVTSGSESAIGSATIEVAIKETTESWTKVQYAVKLWGINRDVDEAGNTLGLTFGPATGDNASGDGTGYVNSFKAHVTQDAYEADDDVYCIHWMTWDEIIEQSKKAPEVFTDCLNNGCTKAVELTPNDKLFNSTAVTNALNQNYTGDGVSTLCYLLNGAVTNNKTYGATWNYNSNSYSTASDPANVYSRSQVRTTLTGDKTNIEEWRAGDSSRRDWYNQSDLCDETNCLLTCFPEELQEAIVPRTTLNTGHSSNENSIGDIPTYDKLFLFSLIETGYNNSNDDSGGTDYGVSGSSSSTAERVAYEFSDANATAVTATQYWTRSRYVQNYTQAYTVNASGSGGQGTSFGATVVYGISPGFCLAGPEGS